MTKDTKYCRGCDDDFYNGQNPMNIKECWHLKTSKVRTKYCIGWWVPQNKKENFTKVKTFNCHTETGISAFYDKLPEHLTH